MGYRRRLLRQLEMILQGGIPLYFKSTISVRVAGGRIHRELCGRNLDIAVRVERTLDGHLVVNQGDKVSVACSTDCGISKPHRLHVHVAIGALDCQPGGSQVRQSSSICSQDRIAIKCRVKLDIQGVIHARSAHNRNGAVSVCVARGVHREHVRRDFNVAVSVERSLDRHSGVREIHKVHVGCGTDGSIRKPHRLHVYVAIIA